MQHLAERLLQDGVVCIPIPEFGTRALRDSALAELDLEISNFPEFNPDYVIDGAAEADGRARMTNKRPLVMGGFAALGTASSFHNRFVRRVRAMLYSHAKMLFQALAVLPEFQASHPAAHAFQFEELIDRLLVRPAGVSPTKEAWHRDSSPSAATDDIIFGGWLNFSQHLQKFSCQLRSHVASTAGGTGTDTGTPADGVGFTPIKDTALKTALAASRASIDIHPGELLVFYDGIIHEIVGAPQKGVVVSRLFTGWRLTHSAEPLMGKDKLQEVLQTGAIVPLKSGQLPPMYAKLHRVNWVAELETFSVAAIREDLLEEVKNKATGKWMSLVPRFMPSLQEMDERFVSYKEDEKRLYMPSPLFTHAEKVE